MNEIQKQASSIMRMSRGMLIFRAVITLVLGVCMLFAPIATMWWMTICIGAVITVDGSMMLAAAISAKDDQRGVMLISACLMIMLGLFSLISPLMMDMVWVMFLGVWQLLSGLQYLFLRKKSKHTMLTILNGIVSVLCGLFFILLPFGGLLAFTWLTAIVLIISGVMAFISAFKL